MILADTHVLIWWANGDRRLTGPMSAALAHASPDRPALVSDISVWEIALLHELGRIKLSMPLRDWLEELVDQPVLRRRGISPAVAAAVAALPPGFHRDPADRLIVATARVYGATVVTADERIVKSGLVPTLS